MTLAGVGAVVAASRWFFRATSPDSFDAIDFLLGMSRKFDLGQLQPHFPGYPVYVALGAALCHLGVTALNAATAVSSLAAGATAVGLALLAERLGGPRAIIPVAALSGVAWLAWVTGSAPLSDSLGIALAVWAFALLTPAVPRLAASGVVAGLLMGTRASYWPLVAAIGVLVLSHRAWGKARLGAVAGFVAGNLLWAVPFFAIVGVHEFVRLGIEHLGGHFGTWGGTVVTHPGLAQRVEFFGRDLFFDGLAPNLWALAAIGGVVGVTALAARLTRRPFGLRFTAWPVVAVLAPYAIWVFLAQNVAEQPRHVLPLVAGGLLLAGCFLSPHRLCVYVIALIAACVSVPLLLERRAVSPAAGQAAEWIARNQDPANTFIVAGRSSRFFRELPGVFNIRQQTWLSDVTTELSRMDRLPTIIVTSEVDLHSGLGPASPLPRNWQIEVGPRFCRDSRIDRADPCLQLSTLVWSPR